MAVGWLRGCQSAFSFPGTWISFLQLEMVYHVGVCVFSPPTDPATLCCLPSGQVSSGSRRRNDTTMTSFSISASISPLYSQFAPLIPVCLSLYPLSWLLACLDGFLSFSLSFSFSFHPLFFPGTHEDTLMDTAAFAVSGHANSLP